MLVMFSVVGAGALVLLLLLPLPLLSRVEVLVLYRCVPSSHPHHTLLCHTPCPISPYNPNFRLPWFLYVTP